MKTNQTDVSPIFCTTCFCILAACMLFFSGCKKEGIDPNDQVSASSELQSDLDALKADIMVHAGGSIQAAVNAAKPGDVVKIEPGTYSEKILISKHGIKLIGITQGNAGVIINNPGNVDTGISVIQGADGVTIANVTVRNFNYSGVVFLNVQGFFITRVTAIHNGQYGIIAVNTLHGTISHCVANGHSDTGISFEESSHATMEFNKISGNVIGMEAENSTYVNISNNKSYDNVAGIFVDLLPGKSSKTASNIYVRDNEVLNNNHKNFGTPGELESFVPVGVGILVLGVDGVVVEKNLVNRNNFVGIVVFSTLVLHDIAGLPYEVFADIEPNPDEARICKNALHNNGSNPPTLPIPLPGVDLLWDGSGAGNCWSNNVFSSSYPSQLPLCN